MKVAILGSSGQIGAYLTEYLRDKGHEVIEFDKNFDENGSEFREWIPSDWKPNVAIFRKIRVSVVKWNKFDIF